MANYCIQVLTYRAGCTIHQHFSKNNYKLFISLRSYGLGSVRSNVHCVKVKAQEKCENPPIPLVSDNTTEILLNKHYLPLLKPNKKLASFFVLQKSQNTLQEVGDIKDFIKSKQADQPSQSQDSDKPQPEQVENVAAELKQDLPNLFSKPQNYLIYHPNLVFENHIKGTITNNLADYAKQLALLKIVGHLKYAFVELQILKLTTHHSEGTIKVRWRIVGLGGMKVFINFWKYKVWNLKDSALKDVESWYDGFSIFYVKGDGVIHKHVLLKMQPDEDHEVDVIKPDMTAKVA